MCWIQNWMMQNCICWAFAFWVKNVIFGLKVTLSVFYGKYWEVVCSFGIAFSLQFDIHLIYESIVGHSIIWGKNKHFQHIWQKSSLFSSNFVFENISFRYIFILTFQSSVEPSQVESWEEFSNWGIIPKFAVFLDKILI